MKTSRKVQNAEVSDVVEIVKDSTGTYVSLLGIRLYKLTVAVTANTTVTTAPAGSLAKTTNATGRASLFVSDGSKWQFLTNA